MEVVPTGRIEVPQMDPPQVQAFWHHAVPQAGTSSGIRAPGWRQADGTYTVTPNGHRYRLRVEVHAVEEAHGGD